MLMSLSALVLLTSMFVEGQRPFFAGSRPIGFPDTPNRTTTTPDPIGNRFGEGADRLPIEANGDRDLIDRLSKLPLDKQPFWFINWKALEENRKKPQTYPHRPSSFVDPVPGIATTQRIPDGDELNNRFSNSQIAVGFSNRNPGLASNVNTGYPNNDPTYTGILNTGYPNTVYTSTGFQNIKPSNVNSNPGFTNKPNSGNSNNGFQSSQPNTGNFNSGFQNSQSNTGNSNTGFQNNQLTPGNSNTDFQNSQLNTGNSNTGFQNSQPIPGNSNTGFQNSQPNTGNSNTGFNSQPIPVNVNTGFPIIGQINSRFGQIDTGLPNVQTDVALANGASSQYEAHQNTVTAPNGAFVTAYNHSNSHEAYNTYAWKTTTKFQPNPNKNQGFEQTTYPFVSQNIKTDSRYALLYPQL